MPRRACLEHPAFINYTISLESINHVIYVWCSRANAAHHCLVSRAHEAHTHHSRIGGTQQTNRERMNGKMAKGVVLAGWGLIVFVVGFGFDLFRKLNIYIFAEGTQTSAQLPRWFAQASRLQTHTSPSSSPNHATRRLCFECARARFRLVMGSQDLHLLHQTTTLLSHVAARGGHRGILRAHTQHT